MNIKSFIKEKKELLKYFIIVFLSLGILYTMLIWFIEMNTVSVKKEEMETNEKRIVNLERTILAKEFDSVISDLLFLSDQFNGLNQIDYEDMAEKWKTFSQRKAVYDQIRFIDHSGNEIIRVNYAPQGAFAEKQDKLQNKKERYYFIDTLKLKKGQIYISKLDLNIENGQVEQPIKPMIRFSTPVFSEDGKINGIVILNYYAQYLLDDFKKISETSAGEVFLLNANGYWISNINQDKEWTFMYEGRENISFKNEFPFEWEQIAKNKEGNIYSENGLYTYMDIVTVNQGLDDGLGGRDDRIVLGEGNWFAVSFVSKTGANGNLFESDGLKRVRSLIYSHKLYYLLLLSVALIFSVLMLINRISKQEIKYFSEYDAMTNIFNRRAGFLLLNENYLKMMKSRGKMSICFIDINGLKEVNDVLGHESGDELILTVVDGIKKCIRQFDFIIRLGGDEFLIIFLNADHLQAEQVWERIENEYRRINDEEDRPYLVSASHGVEECTFKGGNYIDQVINSADEKMYSEKREIKKNITIIRGPKEKTQS